MIFNKEQLTELMTLTVDPEDTGERKGLANASLTLFI